MSHCCGPSPNGPVDASRIPEIYRASRISLNFGDSGLHWKGLRPYRSRQIKARVFEVPAAGGCLLTERAEHIEDYFDVGSEIAVFDGEDDLVEQALALLGDSAHRDAMAFAGHRRTVGEHLYEQRFGPLLEACIASNAPLRRERTDRCDFKRAQQAYRSGRSLRLLRSALVWPLQRLWGERRGTRAARRLLFELSWRLNGAATYRSSGWPGRLFYRES